MKRLRLDQKGFTIIELLIATAIFSSLLLIISVVMTNIGGLYYKGINQNRVQDTVRSISDEVSQKLELNYADSFQLQDGNSGDGTTGMTALCIGNTRYSYVIGKVINASDDYATPHALWRDDLNGDSCKPVNLNSPPGGHNGSELLPNNTRLYQFSANKPAGSVIYDLQVGVAYGGSDLLCNPHPPGADPFVCNDSATTMPFADFTTGELLCKGKAADQYCATAYLDTTVALRANRE